MRDHYELEVGLLLARLDDLVDGLVRARAGVRVRVRVGVRVSLMACAKDSMLAVSRLVVGSSSARMPG